MNRITIDTEDLQSLARVWNAESDQLADIRLDLLRAWSDISPAAYPGVERLQSMGDDISARLANLASTVSQQATDVQLQALRADVDLLGRSVSVLLGTFGPLAALFGTQSLAAWLPMTTDTAATFGATSLDGLGGIGALPTFSTGMTTLDPLAALGAQNGALAPISGVLGQVQQLVNNPIGFLDGPQGQALAASENNAISPIQGLLNQTQAVIQNPLGFSTASLSPSASGGSLANLENAALQSNINRILNGGSFPGSDISSNIFGGNPLTDPAAGLGGFVNNLIASAKADGTFKPGAGLQGALAGGAANAAHTSDIIGGLNFFQGITEGHISDAVVNGQLALQGATSGFGVG